MHLGSVLVGIVIGLAVGALIGWFAGSRRARRPDTAPDRQPSPTEDPGWRHRPRVNESTTPIELVESAAPVPMHVEAPATWSPHPALSTPAEDAPAPEPEPDRSLFESLRAANRRLTDEAQTRLSRESEDLPAENEEPAAPGGSHSAGHDLLTLSRRLAEDSARRLSRDPDRSG
jgi:hypothetical protein